MTDPAELSPAQRVALHEAFDAGALPLRVDVVEARGLAGGIAERVEAERNRLPDLPPGRV